MLAPVFFNTPFIKPIRVNNNINFKGVEFHSTIPELKEDVFEPSLRLIYKEEDFNAIKNSVKKDRFLGAGFEGRVFEMQDSDYVVKVPKRMFNGKKIDNLALKKDLVEEEVTEQDRVNFIEKKYKNGVIVMKKIPGKPASNIDEINEVANLPVKAYQNLLNQIIEADKAGMEFDFAMNNVLYDKDSQSLTAIDFRPYKEGKRKFEPLKKMYFVFDCFKQPYEKKISGKILSAALNNLKTDSETSVYKYDFKEIIRLLEHNCPEDYCNIQKVNYCIQKTIDAKVFENPNFDDYVDNTNEIIEKLL